MALTIGSFKQILDGFQDFNQGEITTTTVELTKNDNGDYFGNIFGNVDTILILKKDDPKTHIYKTGSILTNVSNQVRVTSKNGNVLTLSAVPKNNVEIRIWYKYSASNIPLKNYVPLPFSLSAKAIQSYTTQWLSLASSSSPTTLTSALSMNDFPLYFRGSNGSDTNHFMKYKNSVDGVEIKGYAGILLSGSSGIEFGGDIKLNNKKIEFTNSIFGTSNNYYMGYFNNPSRLELKAYNTLFRIKNNTEVEGNLTVSGALNISSLPNNTIVNNTRLNDTRLYLRGLNNNNDYIQFASNRFNFASNTEFNFNKHIDITGSKFLLAPQGGPVYNFTFNNNNFSEFTSYIYTDYYSLKTSEKILTKGITLTSDKRLKENIKRSSKKEDLRLLEKIKISDYNLINNTRKEKKIIAQDLEQFFPQAVSREVGFIPNINKFVKIKNIKNKNHIIEINLENHDLAIGDELRFKIFKRNKDQITQESIDLFVIDVEKEKIFIEYSAKLEEGKEFYLFGKKVNDMRVIDYQEVFCLNVSATQALLERVEKLESIVLNLRT